MPRANANELEAIVRKAAAEVAASASAAIAKAVAAIAAEELEKNLAAGLHLPLAGGSVAGRSRPRVEMTRWVADKRARRVPNFVIEATGGLKTKKAIVARFGENATFEKGKVLPKPLKATA